MEGGVAAWTLIRGRAEGGVRQQLANIWRSRQRCRPMVLGNTAAGERALCEGSSGPLGAFGGGYGRCWGVVVSQAEDDLG